MNEPLILNGKEVAEKLYSQLPNMNGKKLVIITIGDDDASKVYVRNKILACNKVGLDGINYKFYPSDYKDIKQLAEFIIKTINELNESENVVGIMVQQPYLKELKKYHIEEWIDPNKDVDGLCVNNLGLTCMGEKPYHYPATPKGIITLLDHYNIPLEGTNVVIIGRSDIVGKPLAAMMIARNATVTVCHSKTPIDDLKNAAMHADIIISAVGKAKYFDHTYICELADTNDYFMIPSHLITIIDVGINRDENGKLCGDVDFDDVLPYVSAITPVPKGVGPMTIYSLIENCCKNG